jgi:hypothetical protein
MEAESTSETSVNPYKITWLNIMPWLWSSKHISNVSKLLRDYVVQLYRPDDGSRKHLWNVSELLQDYMPQQPRRQPSS